MITIYVTYSGDAHTRFDREYYVNVHLPLVLKSWGPYGLASVAAFFPAEDGAGTIAVCECKFRDEAALEVAFRSPHTPAVMADVANFTDVQPSRSRAVPL